MSLNPEQHEWVLDLAAEMVNGEADQAQVDRLELILQENPEARRLFLDYTNLHGQLASADAVLRPMIMPQPTTSPVAAPPFPIRRLAAILLAVASIAAVILFNRSDPIQPTDTYAYNLETDATVVATLVEISQNAQMHWQGDTQTVAAGSPLKIGTLHLKQGQAKIKFAGGAVVDLQGPAQFSIDGANEGSLISGTLSAHVPPSAVGFEVRTSGLDIIDRGTDFGVTVGKEGQTHVEVFKGLVETRRRVRLPRMYWSFDGPGKNNALWKDQRATLRRNARRTEGLIGSGAVHFKDEIGASVDLGNGGGTTPGTGRFAVTTGVTIEAMFVSRWSGHGHSNGKPYDYDEIFRKEDGRYRMLLSFQNDHGKHPHVPVKPAVPTGPCLSFGLHLSGDGYSELDMPLDGQNGRPTLAQLVDGRPHHVVATYDSVTGLKALYIDGVRKHQAQFPPGTVIISGGSTSASIGNAINSTKAGEPFTGVIDEVAFYDFALNAEEITEHHQRTRSGQNYFGGNLDAPADPINLAEGQSMKFHGQSGKPIR